jgi:hypothetical protein
MVKEMVNNFARMSTDSLAEYGVGIGQLIYLAGSVLVPVAEDSFDYRMKFLGAFVIGDHIIVNDELKMFYVDPDNFVMIDAEENERLAKIRDKDFTPEPVPSDSPFTTEQVQKAEAMAEYVDLNDPSDTEAAEVGG